MMKNCSYCFVNKAVYNVVPPVCVIQAVGIENAQLCPPCFQKGIDEKEIVWLGDKPYGICNECMEKESAAKAG